jgi:HSP20 family protein
LKNENKKMLGKIRYDNFTEKIWFTNNFNIDMRCIEKPRIQDFNSHTLKIIQETNTKSREDMSTFDIFSNETDVAITLEIPYIEKDTISLRVTKDSIEIMAITTEEMKDYHRFINLPCTVKTKTVKTTYQNGILDITLKRGSEEKLK